jgi:hypothetical protein
MKPNQSRNQPVGNDPSCTVRNNLQRRRGGTHRSGGSILWCTAVSKDSILWGSGANQVNVANVVREKHHEEVLNHLD